MRGVYRILVRVITGGVDMSEHFESIGVCWWQDLCNWWNPPLEARLSPNNKIYCIKCWRWKYEENPNKRLEEAKNVGLAA